MREVYACCFKRSERRMGQEGVCEQFLPLADCCCQASCQVI